MDALVVDRAFWKGKSVLITGHTGFKGGWLSLWLQDMGTRVAGMSLEPPSHPNLFERANIAELMNSRLGDIKDLEVMLSSIRETNPDVIFHMAAQSLVRVSYSSPAETYATNIMGTVNLLEAVRQVNLNGDADVRAVIIVTSDKCYENREWEKGYQETDSMGGADPYASSKGCAELVTSAYRRSYFLGTNSATGVASVRAGNVIGGGDWATDRLVPDAVRAFLAHDTLGIRRPDAIRPWQHVLEPLSGYLLLAQHLYSEGQDFARGWNFGPDTLSEKSVLHVVETLANAWGSDAKWKVDEGQHPHEATYLKLDSRRARSQLGWHPRLSLQDAVTLTVNWYREDQTRASMREFTIKQIQQYERADAMLTVNTP